MEGHVINRAIGGVLLFVTIENLVENATMITGAGSADGCSSDVI